MTDFEGKNNLGTAETFYQRLNYSQRAFPPGRDSIYIKPVRDFNFAESMLYGRINKSHNPIVLNTSNTKKIEDVANGVDDMVAVDFVSDAFKAVVLEFQKAARYGKIDASDPYLYQIKAYSAHKSLATSYANYIVGVESVFLGPFLNKQRDRQITDFRSFLPVFFEFISELVNSAVLTQTAFVTTKFCAPAVSGLVISISDLDPSIDSDKQQFINSPNFGYYVEILKKHGFYINKNRPWELVADIANPYMLQYAARYGLTTEDEILAQYYQRSGGSDLTYLKKMAFETYNQIVLRRRHVKIIQNGKTRRICRDPITLEQIESQYSDNYWLDKYTDIRYAEQHKPLSLGDLSSLKKELKSLLRTQGLTYTLSTINDKLSGFANYNGSFAKISLEQESLRTGKSFKPTY